MGLFNRGKLTAGELRGAASAPQANHMPTTADVQFGRVYALELRVEKLESLLRITNGEVRDPDTNNAEPIVTADLGSHVRTLKISPFGEGLGIKDEEK